MSIQSRVEAALEQGWELNGAAGEMSSPLPESIIGAVEKVLRGRSGPPRQMLLTIAAATAEVPGSNPGSIQVSAGVDRRGQAKIPKEVLSSFISEKGLTLKISKDAGVSNPWREPEINVDWVNGRRGEDRVWAEGFLTVVEWLKSAESDVARGDRAQELLEYVAFAIVDIAAGNSLNYPRFKVSPALAMDLVYAFMRAAPNGPDAMEAVVTAAARTTSAAMTTSAVVTRGDTNSPDAIDILIQSADGTVNSGIEVTDDFISLDKLKHEVLPAMLTLGLDRATVVSRGLKSSDKPEVEAWILNSFVKFGQRIDLAELKDLHTWLSFPAGPAELSTDFIRAIGHELDAYSVDGNRRAWFVTLNDYIETVAAQ